MTAAKRPKIPEKTIVNVLTKCRRRCALCAYLDGDYSERKGQIAHLDHNPKNHRELNLVWLCHEHHDAYDSTMRQSKGYQKGEIRRAQAALHSKLRREERALAPGRTISAYSRTPLQITVTGFARFVRSEGYSERMGDLQVFVSGWVEPAPDGFVTIDISVRLTTNITNRIGAMQLTDIALISGTGKLIARARMGEQFNPGQFNTASFEGIRMKLKKGLIEERFSIAGIRANALAVGVGNTPHQGYAHIGASVQCVVFPGGKVFPAASAIAIGYVRRGLQFDVRSSVTTIKPGESSSRIISYEVSCVGQFYEVFKPREAEASDPQHADSGTIIALRLSSAPQGALILVTSRDLPTVDSKESPIAVAVTAGPNGNKTGTITEFSTYKWNDEIPMVHMESSRMCWECVKAIPRGQAPELRFGLSFVVPSYFKLESPIQASVVFAPYYTLSAAGQPNSFLPIPRFYNSVKPLELPVWT